MLKISPINFVLSIFLLNCTFTSIIHPILERQLLGDDQLEDTLESMISETELTPKYAIHRVKNLQQEINTIRQKCTKYLYVIKNYIAFYQMRKKYQVQKDSEALLALQHPNMTQTFQPSLLSFNSNQDTSARGPSTNSLPSMTKGSAQQFAGSVSSRRLNNHGQQFQQPVLRDYGLIEGKDRDFEQLDRVKDGN